MSDPAAPHPGRGAVCERHGLRFDPATHDGCVLCRRERNAAAAPATAEAGEAIGRPLAVAVLLWVLSGATLYVAHGAVLGSLAELGTVVSALFGGESAGATEDELGLEPTAEEEAALDAALEVMEDVEPPEDY